MNNIDRVIKPKENDIFIFIASTHYHILYSLLLIEKLRIKKTSVIMAKNVPDYIDQIAMQLKQNGYNIIAWGKCYKRNLIGRVKYFYSITQDRRFLSKYRDDNPGKKKVLMNFAWNIKHVYYCAKAYFEICDSAYFFEESPNCYCNYTGNRFEILIKRIVGDKFDYYTEEKLKKIFVTSPEKYPEYLQTKLARMSLFDLWNEIEESAKNTVLKTFISDEIYHRLTNLTNAGIVYTQPLSEDGYISEEEKIRIYKEICIFYGRYGQILLKPHPRDTSVYSFQDVEVIDRLWPSEIITFVGIRFQFAVGICTSAVTGTNADIRMNLNDNFLNDKILEMKPLDLFR